MNNAAPPLAVYTDTDGVDHEPGARMLEEAGFDVLHLDTLVPGAITAGAINAEALLVGYATVTADMMDSMPRLRIIALLSMGFNNVDVAAAAARGIWVTNIPGAASEEVATHALALTLNLTRGLGYYGTSSQDGRWDSRDSRMQQRLSLCTLGVVGLGRIGAKFAEMAAGIFGDVIAYDPGLPDTAQVTDNLASRGIRRTTLEEVQRGCHVLSLHLPLMPSTEGMIDAAFLAQMQQGSFLINVSRGGLVNGRALRAAVESGHLAGAGLDVLDQEPPDPDHPLLGHDRILITPHIAYLSAFTDMEYVRQQAQNVVTWLATGRPETPVAEPDATGPAGPPPRLTPRRLPNVRFAHHP